MCVLNKPTIKYNIADSANRSKSHLRLNAFIFKKIFNVVLELEVEERATEEERELK